MNLHQLINDLLQFDIKVGLFNKNLYSFLSSKIGENEQITYAAEASDSNGGKRPIIITNINIYTIEYTDLIGGMDSIIVPLNRVTSVTCQGGFYYKLMINDGKAVFEMSNLKKKKAEKLFSIITSYKDIESVNK